MDSKLFHRVFLIAVLSFSAVVFLWPSDSYADCSLASVTFGKSSAQVGETVPINLNGEGCNGLVITARILVYIPTKRLILSLFAFPIAELRRRGNIFLILGTLKREKLRRSKCGRMLLDYLQLHLGGSLLPEGHVLYREPTGLREPWLSVRP